MFVVVEQVSFYRFYNLTPDVIICVWINLIIFNLAAAHLVHC